MSAVVSRPSRAAEGPPPQQRAVGSAEAVVPRQQEAGLKRETFAGNNPFLLDVVVHVLQGVKAKIIFPQFILNHG